MNAILCAMRFFAIIGGFWLLVAARKVKVDAGGFSAEMHDHAEELTNSFEQITDNFKLDEEVLDELNKDPKIKKVLEANKELSAMLSGAKGTLDEQPDENDNHALHERMKTLHRLIEQMHVFQKALKALDLRKESLDPDVVDRIRDLKKTLKVLPAMEEVNQVLQLTKMLSGMGDLDLSGAGEGAAAQRTNPTGNQDDDADADAADDEEEAF